MKTTISNRRTWADISVTGENIRLKGNAVNTINRAGAILEA